MGSLPITARMFSVLWTTMASLVRWMFGWRDIPRLFYSSTVATVAVRKSGKQGDATEVSLKELVETRCHSLHDEFKRAWWLPR